MKTIITKIALIFLSIVVIIMMAINTYTFIVAYKISVANNFFDIIGVVRKYKVLDKVGICAFAMLLTIILLAIFLGFIVKTFVIKTKKVYHLEEVKS
jgi:hypothetical protein